MTTSEDWHWWHEPVYVAAVSFAGLCCLVWVFFVLKFACEVRKELQR